MKLIDLLVKELPKRGGWNDEAVVYAQDSTGTIYGYKYPNIQFNNWGWSHPSGYSIVDGGHECKQVSTDHNAALVNREQYEPALAASEGWIEWGGGECPVHESANVDIKLEDGSEKGDVPASAFIWQHDDDVTNITAYRLHKPDINSLTSDDRLERDLNECIGQDVDPTWNGDGLPPVGTICEAKVPRSITGWEWREVKVVESGIHGAEKEVLVYDLETTFPSWVDEFRPLRTEAERAREDAETAIRTCLAGTGAGITPLAAKGIYEAIAAGKIPGVKLENK